jgi:hypothetical protein
MNIYSIAVICDISTILELLICDNEKSSSRPQFICTSQSWWSTFPGKNALKLPYAHSVAVRLGRCMFQFPNPRLLDQFQNRYIVFFLPPIFKNLCFLNIQIPQMKFELDHIPWFCLRRLNHMHACHRQPLRAMGTCPSGGEPSDLRMRTVPDSKGCGMTCRQLSLAEKYFSKN